MMIFLNLPLKVKRRMMTLFFLVAMMMFIAFTQSNLLLDLGKDRKLGSKSDNF